jgi:hypothetical protein
MTRQISRRYPTYIHVILSILHVTIVTASLMRAVSAKTIVCNLPDDVLHVHTEKKKKNPSGVKFGDLGGQAISAPLPIHPPGIL